VHARVRDVVALLLSQAVLPAFVVVGAQADQPVDSLRKARARIDSTTCTSRRAGRPGVSDIESDELVHQRAKPIGLPPTSADACQRLGQGQRPDNSYRRSRNQRDRGQNQSSSKRNACAMYTA
jgi:hypothetical protein